MAFIKVRTDLIENTDISNGDFRLLCLLIERKGYFRKKSPIFYCNREWIGEQLGKSGKSGVITDAIARLEDAGYICVDRKSKETNKYILNGKADFTYNVSYIVVDTSIIYDKEISDRDFRVLCWLLLLYKKLKQDQPVFEINFNVKDFSNTIGMSRNTIDRAMKVLMDAKYVIFTGKNNFFIHPNLIPSKSKIEHKKTDDGLKTKWLEEHKSKPSYPTISETKYCKMIDKWFVAS